MYFDICWAQRKELLSPADQAMLCEYYFHIDDFKTHYKITLEILSQMKTIDTFEKEWLKENDIAKFFKTIATALCLERKKTHF